MSPVLLPPDFPCDFPNLRIPSEDHIIKRVEATIEEEKGEYYGIARKSSGIPDGFGVFRTSDWVHCGQVKDGVYQQGRKISVSTTKKLLTLTDKKCLGDGTVMKKIEKFSKYGMERCFTKDGQEIAPIIPRLNRGNDALNWLSMQPNPMRWYN
jgi:hypothetical protein